MLSEKYTFSFVNKNTFFCKIALFLVVENPFSSLIFSLLISAFGKINF